MSIQDWFNSYVMEASEADGKLAPRFADQAKNLNISIPFEGVRIYQNSPNWAPKDWAAAATLLRENGFSTLTEFTPDDIENFQWFIKDNRHSYSDSVWGFVGLILLVKASRKKQPDGLVLAAWHLWSHVQTLVCY